MEAVRIIVSVIVGADHEKDFLGLPRPLKIMSLREVRVGQPRSRGRRLRRYRFKPNLTPKDPNKNDLSQDLSSRSILRVLGSTCHDGSNHGI